MSNQFRLIRFRHALDLKGSHSLIEPKFHSLSKLHHSSYPRLIKAMTNVILELIRALKVFDSRKIALIL